MLKKVGNKLIRRFDKELLVIESYGKGLRVRATERDSFLDDELSALLPDKETEAEIILDGPRGQITNGKITCKVLSGGELQFYNQKGELLLEEYSRNRQMYSGVHDHFESALEIKSRTFEPRAGADNYKLTVRFESANGEKIFGMGQYQQPYLDLKGCTLELAQRNSQASVPFMISNRGYGFLWNNPAIGQVTFAKNITEWMAHSTKQMDYFIVAGDTPAEIEAGYAEVAGTVPMMPEYGMGFWQCKLRYQTQDEILKVAHEYYDRKIPVDVIVVDYFHWVNEGDWDFDKKYWPDPAGMVKELKSLGMHLMVSVWPTVNGDCERYPEMAELGYLTRSEYGKRLGQLGKACFIDVTNPDCRDYVWSIIKKNYYDLGIKVFWLDEAEPELTNYEYQHYRYYKGADLEVGNVYPREYARMTYEGQVKEGQENVLNLLRCAWAGSQRYGALVWSGDIDSSFSSLRNQLRAGLNMGIAGIPWWTTDIGGFHGGNINDEAFREVFARWFAFGAFCPVMRLHGFREPFKAPMGTVGGAAVCSGADNEVWSYGDRIYEICRRYIELREKMRPYTRDIMKAAHENGAPVMRPLFFDFPEDPIAWDIDDQYMFGPDILVAPVLYENVTERKVYVPDGEWINLDTREEIRGGAWITAPAPYEYIPVFIKKGTAAQALLLQE